MKSGMAVLILNFLAFLMVSSGIIKIEFPHLISHFFCKEENFHRRVFSVFPSLF